MTSLKSENIFTAFPPILWTMDIPSSKASYSASLFVAEKPNLNDFSMVSFLGEIRTSPTPEPLWFAAPSTYTFQNKGYCREIVPTDFPSMFCVVDISSNRGSVNLATKSASTWPLTKVRDMYLMSKTPRTATLQSSSCNQHFKVRPWVEVELGRQLYVLGSNGEVFVYHAPLSRWLSPMVDNEPRPHVVTCSHSKLVVVCHC